MFTKPIRLETTDNNRLANFKDTNALAKQVLESIDETKTKEVNPNFVADDLRVDDSRRLTFNCPKCGDSYVRSVKGRMHYGKGCRRFCDEEDNDPNVVSATEAPRLKSVKNGEVLARLKLFQEEKGSKALMGEMPVCNRSKLNFKCADCDKTFASSIRAQSGYCPPGQPHLNFVDGTFNNVSVSSSSSSSSSSSAAVSGSIPTTSMMSELQSRCPECQFKMAMNRARKQMGNDVESGKKGFYGGLAF